MFVFTMKRLSLLTLAALAGVALFAGLVYAVLRVAHVSEPAATTLHGPTVRRLWATSAVAMALAGVIVSGLAFARPMGRFATRKWRRGMVITGVIAAINGSLVLAMANGGPGSGNGVVGGAAALVLGLMAITFGGCLAPAPSADNTTRRGQPVQQPITTVR